MIFWTLWWRRNQRCWNDKIPTIFEVICRAREIHQEWLKMQRRNMNTKSIRATPASYSWSKPSTNKLKCNVGTTCYTEDNSFSVGACNHEEYRQFLEANTSRFQGIPTIAEATRMREALHWIWHNYREVADIEVESDCLQVLQDINSMNTNNTGFGSLIDIWLKLLNLRKNCRIDYVRRQTNQVARDLAQTTRFITSPQFFNYCPPCIELLLWMKWIKFFVSKKEMWK
jgi:hypothetical protein